MAVFQYRALQSDSRIAEGKLEAGGRQEAFRQMEGLGLRPISLAESKNGKTNGATHSKPKPEVKNKLAKAEKKETEAPLTISFGSGGKISPRVLENFTRLLSSLLAAGVPLSRALVILQKEAANPAAKARWKDIHDLVVDGVSLADAMARFPDTAPSRPQAKRHRLPGREYPSNERAPPGSQLPSAKSPVRG